MTGQKRRIYGEHLTSIHIFNKFILPKIRRDIYKYRWVDLFAGEGNLILPILSLVPESKRVEFFREHIFLFDLQHEMVEKSVSNACKYGIPEKLARKNIVQRDTIKDYPTFIINTNIPVYHITNPPYLYIGYIAKHEETQRHLDYFSGDNSGYQDIYQLALINDLRHGINRMIYIIPSNFLFGFSVSNKIRDDFLQYYTIEKAFIFEKRIFEFTGTNVVICFFNKKQFARKERIIFEGVKINTDRTRKTYVLEPHTHFRAGNEFEEFVKQYKANTPLEVRYYLTNEEVQRNVGNERVEVIDANAFDGRSYKKRILYVNKNLHEKIKSNILFVRTVDTGSMEGRAGLYVTKEIFDVDGIFVSSKRYRTHPIQIFIEPCLTRDKQILLRDYFNLMLEHFREVTDSEFMTTYKYSNSDYTRKYLGLSQVRQLISTFPVLDLTEKDPDTEKEFERFKRLIKAGDSRRLLLFIESINKGKEALLWH